MHISREHLDVSQRLFFRLCSSARIRYLFLFNFYRLKTDKMWHTNKQTQFQKLLIFVTHIGPQLTFQSKWSFFYANWTLHVTHTVIQLKVIIFRYLCGVTTDLHATGWESDHFSWLTLGHNCSSWHSMRKWSFFVAYAGSQLTFMTQHEKMIIFRYECGVTTDLLDV